MPYRRGYGRRRFSRRSSGFSSGGTFYGSAARANYEVKRHIIDRNFTCASDRCIIIPMLCYNGDSFTTEQRITDYDGTVQSAYPACGVKEGSTVRGMNLDILVKPTTASDADVIDFYTARIVTSFHDLLSGQVRGIQLPNSGADRGIPAFQNDAKDLEPTSAAAAFHDSLTYVPPSLDFDINKFYLTPTLRHWWRGVRKTTIAAGQPAQYRMWENCPRKCVRSNPGMLWAMVFMNDSESSVSIDFKSRFQEIPLIQ